MLACESQWLLGIVLDNQGKNKFLHISTSQDAVFWLKKNKATFITTATIRGNPPNSPQNLVHGGTTCPLEKHPLEKTQFQRVF